MTEAYTSLSNTTKYYMYGSHIPFNFKFITDVNSTSTVQQFESTIQSWMSSMPQGQVANWVVSTVYVREPYS